MALLLCETSGAQVQKRGYTEAVIGTDINDILPDDMIFMYPEFLKGSVHFLDRSVAEGVMNIYLPGLQLYFIDSMNTLVMRNQDEARLLTIGHDTYLRHDKTWVRMLSYKRNSCLLPEISFENSPGCENRSLWNN